MRIIEKREASETENVLKPGRPIRSELSFHHFNQPLGKLMLELRVNVLERVERSGIIPVRRVDNNNVFYSLLGNKIQNFFDNVTVRVNETKTMIISDVLTDEKLQHF